MPLTISTAAPVPTVCFLHIPKTAGRTLEAILGRFYAADVTFDAYGDTSQAVDRLRSLPAQARRRLRLIKGHYAFGLHKCLPQSATYITFLRDPIERVISHYYYVLRDRTHPLHTKVKARGMNLQEYVAGGHSLELDNGQVRLLSGQERQHAFGCCSPRLLDLAKQNIERHFALVGIVERFDESLVLLQHRFKWGDVDYERRNVTKRRIRRVDVPDRVLDTIWQHNQLDFKLYAFARRQLEQAVADAGPALHRTLGRLRRQNRGRTARRWTYALPIAARQCLMKAMRI